MRLALSALLVAAAVTVADASPRVQRQITATSDVHDIAAADGRVLLATSGGLVISNGGAVDRVMTSLDALPGTRLRSVSATDDGIWVGGIDGAARLGFDERGALRVSRTVALRRVRRAIRWGDWVWLATFGDGLYRLAAGDAEADPERVELGELRERITDLAVHGDRLWVATAGAGILELTVEGTVDGTIDRRSGLLSNLVWDLTPVGSDLLVATAAGINRARGRSIDRRAAVTRASRRLRIRDVRAIAVRDTAIFAGTFGAGT